MVTVNAGHTGPWNGSLSGDGGMERGSCVFGMGRGSCGCVVGGSGAGMESDGVGMESAGEMGSGFCGGMQNAPWAGASLGAGWRLVIPCLVSSCFEPCLLGSGCVLLWVSWRYN